jgi:ABC-type dipeptide/oligopeptide/nickel transport system permease subunit
MEDKSSKTIWTIVIALIIFGLAAVLLVKFWVSILTLVIGFFFGFYFGWSKGRAKK